jgi:hypothetical protein
MSVVLLARVVAVLVAAGAPLPVALAATATSGPLDELAARIEGLKASLGTIREQMTAMRTGAAPPQDACAVADEEDPGGAAGQADWRQVRAAMTGELIDTRERLAAAEGAAAALRQDRERLVGRILELDQMLAKAHTSELVDDLVERRAALEPVDPPPVEPPARPALATPGLLQVARPALAGEPLPPDRAGAVRRSGSRLDLQAELALAQLRIVELNTALEAARRRHETMAAELTALRSLSGGPVARFEQPRR